MDAISEIKARLPIEELVASYIPLKRSGRHFKGLCPFHNEKTPSFIVSPEKELAYCFGCRRGGDIFKFTEEMEGLDFRGALTLLAERTGVKLPKRVPEKKGETQSERQRLITLMQRALTFFEENLWDKKIGAAALSYLRKRGFEDDIVKEFHVGYAPDSGDALYPQLLREGFTASELLSVGLVFSHQTNTESIRDFFRHRVIFPIFNIHGQPVAFGGRILKEDDEPKYLNSPESPIFSKRTGLYGLSHGKTEIRKTGRAILVEGYTDVMASYQAGVHIALATCGTALTHEQVRLVKRYATTLCLSFDTDEAGRKAQRRAISLCQTEDLTIHLITPEGKDPAEMVEEDPQKWKELCDSAPYYLDFFYPRLEKILAGATFADRKRVLTGFVPILAGIVNPAERDSAVQKFSVLFQISPQSLYETIEKIMKENERTNRLVNRQEEKKDDVTRNEKITIAQYLLGLLIYCSASSDFDLSEFSLDDFENENEKSLYKALQKFYSNRRSPGKSAEKSPFDLLNEEEANTAKIFSLYAETRNSTLSPDAVDQETKQVLRQFIRRRYEEKLQRLVYEMKDAERKRETARFNTLLHDYQELLDLWQKR